MKPCCFDNILLWRKSNLHNSDHKTRKYETQIRMLYVGIQNCLEGIMGKIWRRYLINALKRKMAEPSPWKESCGVLGG
jgi:hypothetical protein